MVFNCRSLFNEAAYLAALRRLRSPFAIGDADSKQSKTKIYDEKMKTKWRIYDCRTEFLILSKFRSFLLFGERRAIKQ